MGKLVRMAGLEVWRWWEYLRYINVDTVYRPVRSSLLNSHQRPYDVLIIFIYLIYWSRKMNCKGKSSGSGSLVLYSDCCIQCFINITQTRSDLFKAVVVILCLVDAFHHSCFSYQMWLNCHKENSIIWNSNFELERLEHLEMQHLTVVEMRPQHYL